MNEIVEKVCAFAQENKLFAPGQRLCAAVSGGADSMALLRLLLRIQPVFGYELTACHVNHGLRGEPADRDEAFVRAECARLNVPLRVFHPADVGAAVPAHPGEDWARKLRYACFDALRAGGIDAVATAHTATDQTETLLFRLARGAGLHGAAGIRPSRPGFCRPLLCLTRAETEQACTACGQRWVTDETNASDAYARNRLRHAALPALRSVNEAAEEISPASVKRPPARMPTLHSGRKSCWKTRKSCCRPPSRRGRGMRCRAAGPSGGWKGCRRPTR